tara:strand:- start:4217 stop:5083 length:867 start_codon:yes stop_codon:yes gene_type:complete
VSVGWKQLITTDDIYNYVGEQSITVVSISPPVVYPFLGVYNCNNNLTTDAGNYCVASYFPTTDGWQNVTPTKKNNTLTHWKPRFCTAMLEKGMLNPYKDSNWKISSVNWKMWIPGISTSVTMTYPFIKQSWYLDFIYADLGSSLYVEQDVQMQEEMGDYYTNDADDISMEHLLQQSNIAGTNVETYNETNAIKIHSHDNALVNTATTEGGNTITSGYISGNPAGEGVLISGNANNFHTSSMPSFNSNTIVIPQIFKRWTLSVGNNDSSNNQYFIGNCQIKLQITIRPA